MNLTFEILETEKQKLIKLFGADYVEKLSFNDFMNFYKTRKHFKE